MEKNNILATISHLLVVGEKERLQKLFGENLDKKFRLCPPVKMPNFKPKQIDNNKTEQK